MHDDWIILHTFNSEKQTLISKRPFNELLIFCVNLKHFDKNIKECISEGKPAGLYFFINTETIPRPSIYVGKTDNFMERFQNHLRGKDKQRDLRDCNILIGVYYKAFDDNYSEDDVKFTYPFQITFLKDHLTSVSTASNIILGNSNNGWIKWKDENGEVIDKIWEASKD